jgi:hypothetical protein
MRMRSSRYATRLAAALSIVAASALGAQARSVAGVPAPARARVAAQETTEGVQLGYTDIAAVIGIGGISGASFALGVRGEKVIKELPDLGNGLLGIQISVDWWHYSADYGVGSLYRVDQDWSIIPIGAIVTYHFRIEGNPKIDPFIGAGIVYWIENVSCTVRSGSFTDNCADCAASGIHAGAKAGVRWAATPKAGLYADVGIGGAALNVGGFLKIG